MRLKLYELKLKSKKKLVKFWYGLMKPIGYFFTTEKVNKRYENKQDKITEKQAVKLIAEDIARYAIKYYNEEISLLICDFANEDHFWNGCTLGFSNPYIKRDKTRMAYYKFKKTVEFQEKIMEVVKKIKELEVTEEIESFTWQSIKNYKKTYHIKKKSK